VQFVGYKLIYIYQGYAVVQLVEALCYKPESCMVNSQLGSLGLFIYLILPAALQPWGQFSL